MSGIGNDGTWQLRQIAKKVFHGYRIACSKIILPVGSSRGCVSPFFSCCYSRLIIILHGPINHTQFLLSYLPVGPPFFAYFPGLYAELILPYIEDNVLRMYLFRVNLAKCFPIYSEFLFLFFHSQSLPCFLTLHTYIAARKLCSQKCGKQ